MYRNPRKHKNNQLLIKFGITIEDYEAMLKAQNGLCAICKTPNKDGRALAVDHCHKTLKKRGLLCGNCNRGIGNLQECPAILFAAIQYLNQRG